MQVKGFVEEQMREARVALGRRRREMWPKLDGEMEDWT